MSSGINTAVADRDLDARIIEVRAELACLEARRRARLVAVIAAVIPPGVVFTSAELFEHRTVSPELVAELESAHIVDARTLGKRLRSLSGLGLERAGVENHRALWAVVR